MYTIMLICMINIYNIAYCVLLIQMFTLYLNHKCKHIKVNKPKVLILKLIIFSFLLKNF